MYADPLRLAADLLEQGISARSRVWVPRFHQRAPDGDWDAWALIGGRGSGKTDGGAHYVAEHVKGPPCLAGAQPHRIAIVAPTLGDAVEACVTGPSGLKEHDHSARMVQGIGGTYVRWPNGSEAKLFGAFTPEDVERFRAGGNRCLAWLEEVAAWRMLGAVLEQVDFGLREGPHPRKIITSTPKAKKAFKELLAEPGTVRSYTEDGRIPTMNDNPDLPAHIRVKLTKKYGATRLGRQELGGEMLDDIPGAYWQAEAIEENRITLEELPVNLARVVVAIDPAATAEDTSDETGIITGAKAIVQPHPIRRPGIPNMDVIHPDAPHAHYFLLADDSLRGSPTEWATAAVRTYDEHHGDRIVGEVNNGGDMVESTIRTVRREIPFKKVHASRGKDVRAQPISALYEQDLVHHVGALPELEDQMTAYTGPESIEFDDRLDAAVYCLTELATGGVAFMAGAVHHGRGSGGARSSRRVVSGNIRGD